MKTNEDKFNDFMKTSDAEMHYDNAKYKGEFGRYCFLAGCAAKQAEVDELKSALEFCYGYNSDNSAGKVAKSTLDKYNSK